MHMHRLNRGSTTYTAHRLGLDPDTAQGAFDRLTDRDREFAFDGGTIALHGRGFVRRPEGAVYFPYRAVPGVLTVGHHSAPVEVELVPWSHTDTELAIRQTGRRRSARAAERLIAAAREALEQLAVELEHAALAPAGSREAAAA